MKHSSLDQSPTLDLLHSALLQSQRRRNEDEVTLLSDQLPTLWTCHFPNNFGALNELCSIYKLIAGLIDIYLPLCAAQSLTHRQHTYFERTHTPRNAIIRRTRSAVARLIGCRFLSALFDEVAGTGMLEPAGSTEPTSTANKNKQASNCAELAGSRYVASSDSGRGWVESSF